MAQGKATISAVADAAGVAKATVSLALSGKGTISEETRQRIRTIARKMDYKPNPRAQDLSHGRSNNTIALFSPNLSQGWVGTAKLQIVQRLLSEMGYSVPVHIYGGHTERSADSQVEPLKMLCRERPRAIIFQITSYLHERALVELRHYQEEGGIVISYDSPMNYEWDKVIFDRFENTYKATRHLLEIGHRDIGLWLSDYSSPRFPGFCQALSEFGVPIRNEWLYKTGVDSKPFYLFEEAGGQLAETILAAKNRPTGLVVLDDSTAMSCLSLLQRAGWSVPGDISIIGHDDGPIARFGPVPLTTVTHPVEAIAHEIVNLLQKRLVASPDEPMRESVLYGKLVVRESTAPPFPKR